MTKTKITKTIFIYDNMGEQPIRFFVKKGDYTRFDGIYINDGTDDKERQELIKEFCDLVYDKDSGQDLIKFKDKFPIEIPKEDNVAVIVCGFYP